jgi:hypothetical protein
MIHQLIKLVKERSVVESFNDLIIVDSFSDSLILLSENVIH